MIEDDQKIMDSSLYRDQSLGKDTTRGIRQTRGQGAVMSYTGRSTEHGICPWLMADGVPSRGCLLPIKKKSLPHASDSFS